MINTENFLSEEVRNDYQVTTDMKKVWLVQLELFSQFISVCNEHYLKYWVVFGTLLGAVRHGGYIPWDDDLDVVMPREDYDILCAHREWFSAPSALSLPNNKENYFMGFARLQNINTSCIYPRPQGNICKQGIYIDILPLDAYNGLKTKKLVHKLKFLDVLGHACTFNVNPNFILRVIYKINSKLHMIKPESLYKKIESMVRKDNNPHEEYLCVKVLHDSNIEKMLFRKSTFQNTVKMPFEFLEVNVPEGYDEQLRVTYGEYMNFPPIEKRGTWHNFIFDPDIPYKNNRINT